MPATLTALFAVAIHGARRSEAEPTEAQRAAAMLVTAAGARKLSWQLRDGTLMLNGTPIAGDTPGARDVAESMLRHATERLDLPAALTADQWSELAGVFASAAGLYPSLPHLRAAVTGVVPGAIIESGPTEIIDDEEDVRESGQGDVDRSVIDTEDEAVEPSLVSREADRAGLSDLLDPLLQECREAVRTNDWRRLARALTGLHEISERGDGATAAIITQERRRVVPASAVRTLIRLLPAEGTTSQIALGLSQLGREAAEALLDALAENPSRGERRVYMDVLAHIEGAEPALVAALTSTRPELIRDAVETIGRIRLVGAVPVIGVLLKHADEDVRAAAWRALESIGTKEALEELER